MLIKDNMFFSEGVRLQALLVCTMTNNNEIVENGRTASEGDPSNQREITQSFIRRYAIQYISPVIITIAISLLFTLPISITGFYVPILPFTPEMYPDNPAVPALLNTAFFMLIAVLGAVLVVFLLRRHKDILYKLLLTFGLLFSGTVILWYFFDATISALNVYTIENQLIVIIVSFTLGSILMYLTVHYKASFLRNLAVVIYGGLIGAFLGPNIWTWTVVLILIALSLYDIYGVRKGPIREIILTIEQRRREIPILTYTSRDWEIGIGDLAFYSMFTSHIFTQYGVTAFLLVTVGIVIGSLITLKLLEKKGMLPGLPIPIALGLVGFILFFIISIFVPLI